MKNRFLNEKSWGIELLNTNPLEWKVYQNGYFRFNSKRKVIIWLKDIIKEDLERNVKEDLNIIKEIKRQEGRLKCKVRMAILWDIGKKIRAKNKFVRLNQAKPNLDMMIKSAVIFWKIKVKEMIQESIRWDKVQQENLILKLTNYIHFIIIAIINSGSIRQMIRLVGKERCI